jgi:probable HAF family extracellular repeat protein
MPSLPPSRFFPPAEDADADGSVIVGSGDSGSGSKGFRWTQSTGMVSLGSLNGSSHYFGVSADGSVVVGDSGQQAFRWTQSGGITGLGFLPGLARSYADDVSADGSVVVGTGSTSSYGLQQAFRWTQSGGMIGLGFLPGSTFSFSNAVSPDGSVVVGTCEINSISYAFRWTQSTGMVNIGSLPGMDTTHPLGVTTNGSTIVGTSYDSNSLFFQADIWDAAHGMRNLKSVLQTDYGLNLAGWNLQVAYDITPDGNYIVGYGLNPSGQQEAFLVTLVPEPATLIQLGLAAILLGLTGIRRFRRRVRDCFQMSIAKH